MKTKTSTPQRLLVLSALVGSMALGGVAMARPGGPGGHRGMREGGPAMRLLRAMEDLDLSEQQEVQLVRIKRELRKENKDLRTAMRADGQATFTELQKETPNAQRLHEMLDRHTAARTAAMHKALDKVLAFHATLTPAQRTQLQEKLQRFQKRMERRRQRFEK